MRFASKLAIYSRENSSKLLSLEAFFYFKMHHKPFGGRALPGPAGGAKRSPSSPDFLARLRGGLPVRGGQEWCGGGMGRGRVEEGEGWGRERVGERKGGGGKGCGRGRVGEGKSRGGEGEEGLCILKIPFKKPWSWSLANSETDRCPYCCHNMLQTNEWNFTKVWLTM